MTTDFKPGDFVTVTINARIAEVVPGGALRMTFRQPEHLRALPMPLVLPTHSPDIAYEWAPPPNWPPRVGDIWTDADGERWFAQDDGTSDVEPPVMWMVPAHPHRFSPEHDGGARGYQAARWRAKRGPVSLVYREAEADSAVPA